MLGSVRRLVEIPHVAWGHVASVAVAVAFCWLLLHDQLHPLVIYFAQMFLAF